MLGIAHPGSGGNGVAGLATGADLTPSMLALPVLVLLPNFLYALFLLRRRKLLPESA
jgi:hypothetical protein